MERKNSGLLCPEMANSFLYSVSDHTSANNRLKIEPVFDGTSTAITQYKVTDDNGSIWIIGTREECEAYLK